MTRRITLLSLALLLALSLTPTIVTACGDGTTCDVERSCEKTDNGIRCTVKAKGDTSVATRAQHVDHNRYW